MQTLSDGSRWLWTEGRWDRVDPSGTDLHEVRWSHRAMPAMDLAIRRAREQDLDKADADGSRNLQILAGELADLVDNDDIALLEAAGHVAYFALRDLERGKRKPSDDGVARDYQAATALRTAATLARRRMAADDEGIRTFEEALQRHRDQ